MKRTGERPCEEPGEGKAEDERDQADTDQAENVPPHPPVDRIDALRHPDRAADAVSDDDRDRRIEKGLVQRVTEAAALGDPAGERGLDLRAVS